MSRRRLALGLLLAAVLLPALTVVLTVLRSHLALDDDLLLYLLAVLAITLIGGVWPAVLAALTAGLLLNWYFTPPTHAWTIEAPTNILALVLFVAAAVAVSSVVHLAARRAAIAAQRADEANALRVQAGRSDALAAANEMRTALLTAVSHDLRTPLASVKAAVSSLRQGDVAWSAADRAALLATIEDGADRLAGLIANLLDMSRIQTGAVEPFLRPVALDEVVPVVARDLDRGSEVLIELQDGLPLLRTDPGLLERVLANVVANALRHSPPNRPPLITATELPEGSALQILVIDHGPGIPADARERAFEPFQQLGDQRPAGGVGLGLAVARGFVGLLGGHISAYATTGGGLTVQINMPTTAAVPNQPAGRS